MPDSILVMGIGNLLWADEGFGVRCIEALDAAWTFPARVEVLDGGTQGLYLLPHVQAAQKLLVFDAIDWGLPPGTLRMFEGDEVPRFMGAKKMSLHQTGFQDVLACAELCGQCPRELVLIGVQPVELEDFGGSLRDAVRLQIEPALQMALRRLRAWGVEPQPRSATSPQVGSGYALAIDRYEAGRPSEAEACRFGDERFLGRR